MRWKNTRLIVHALRLASRRGYQTAIILLFISRLISCASSSGTPVGSNVADIPEPPGFTRTADAPGSFAAWLLRLPLKNDRTIRLFTGEILHDNHYDVLAVVDKPLLFREDLEQCIDFCLRLWADYHYETGRLDQLYLFSYNGSKVYWTDFRKTSSPSATLESTYRDFLKNGLAWTNPHSITLGAQRIASSDAQPGDCIIQTVGRLRGQASLMLDECTDGRGNRLFLIGFGFSPAQEFHIEKAPPEFGAGGWFSLEGYIRYLDRYYHSYGKPGFYRF